MREKLEIMLKMQDELNSATCGKEWKNGRTRDGREINWPRCIFMESAELLDSFNWKHWKSINSAHNLDNAKIELVDIWHFILSFALENNLSLFKLCKENLNLDEENYEIFDEIRGLINESSNKKPNLNKILSHFWRTAKAINLNFDELYKIYIGKNVLNKFRQDKGYKNGTYVKIWQGREDNEIMQELLNLNAEPKALYTALEEKYKNLN